MKLGINGLGRIGKLSLWHHVSRKHFSEIVVNVGRQVGTGLQDIASSIDRDSSYGRLGMYLHGCKSCQVIENLNEAAGTMTINGVLVKILRESRNPAGIQWKENGVRLVVDTTGAFTDPTADADSPKGALRGHVQAGAEKVLLSAPFKIKNKGLEMPADAVTTVMGINDGDFNPSQHTLISAASCTTTCLSFMIKPLLDHFGADRFLSASMVTVHAATGSQHVLDRLPNAGATDVRKNRSIFNNIILTTTGAAKALPLVIQWYSPEGKLIRTTNQQVRYMQRMVEALTLTEKMPIYGTWTLQFLHQNKKIGEQRCDVRKGRQLEVRLSPEGAVMWGARGMRVDSAVIFFVGSGRAGKGGRGGLRSIPMGFRRARLGSFFS